MPEARAQEDPLGSYCALPEGAPQTEVAQLNFPNHGVINALVIFVQHKDDYFEACVDYTTAPATDLSTNSPGANNPCYAGPDVPHLESWTDDEATEWPAEWSRGPDRRLPQYASNQWLAPPGSAPSAYVEGSLSQYYYLNSGGRFRLHGYVYPKVYIPQYDRSEYKNNPGSFPNGGVRLSHEIVSYVDANPEGINFNQRFDRYTNGTNVTVHDVGDDARDGIFDMIIMVFRFNNPCDLGVPLSPATCAIRPTGLTGLGSNSYNPSYNGFSSDPLYLGSLEVIDNFVSGSGVWSAGSNSRLAVFLTAHEIGHRQFYYQHSVNNNYSVMHGGTVLAMMGANERVQLGWTTVRTVDIDALASPLTPLALGDTFLDDEVLLIEEGPEARVRLIEARTHANFWDRPPDGINADGDRIDFHIPEEGLLVYVDTRSGSSLDNTSSYSMENHGLPGRPRCFDDAQGYFQCAHSGRYHFTFSPGDALTPLSNFPFSFTENEGLDDRLALTDITPYGTGFGFNVWRDFLVEDAAPKVVHTNYTLSNQSFARTDDWTFGGDIVFDDGFSAPPTATNPSITLLPDARFIVPVDVDATLLGEPGQRFPFVAGAGARVRVAGASQLGRVHSLAAFNTHHVTFQAADASGWKGLYFGNGARGRLYDTRVEGVAWPTAQLTNAAIAAYDADLVLDDESRITGAVKAHGLFAAGGTVTVKGLSRIFDNEGYGVVSSVGASVTVTGDARVDENHAGGVGATGYGSVAVLDNARVFQNYGPGVHVMAGASTDFVPAVVLNEQVEVGGNEGGLSATDGGVLNAGLCDRPGCIHIPHEVTENTPNGNFFDARSLTGSTLFAEGNFWGFGVDDPSDLILIQDGSSFLSVEPIATTPGVPFTERLAGSPGRGVGSLSRGSGQTAVVLIAEAERLLAAGDTTSAGALVVDALTGVAADTSATGDDHRAAFEGAGRFLALTQPAEVVGWLGDRAAEGGALRPWALRALAVAHASAEAMAEAEAAAVSLVGEDPSGEHGRVGHGHLVRLAVFVEDEAGALSRLAAMAGAFPEAEATVQAASVVAAAFPEADVDGALNGAGGRVAGVAPGAAQASASAGVAPVSFVVSEVRPNPVGGALSQVALPVSLSAEARVEAVLYDALGRRLGLVHANALGEGEHTLTLSTAPLPSGVYVVHVTARGLDGTPRVAVRRFTVVR